MKIILAVVGGLLLAALLVVLAGVISEQVTFRTLRTFCREIRPDEPIAPLRARATHLGFEVEDIHGHLHPSTR